MSTKGEKLDRDSNRLKLIESYFDNEVSFESMKKKLSVD